MDILKITRESGIPLIGCIAFGVLDRGTNLIEVRPSSACNLNCVFCSTNANNKSVHPFNYEVELPYLLDWINDVVRFKGSNVEIHFDSVGEPLMYRDFIKLVDSCSKVKGVSFLSMQTNGLLLTEKNVDALEKAGINRINLSLNTLDPEKAKLLSCTDSYNIKKVISIARYISKSKIELLLAPVWLPGINDKDIEEIIMFGKSLNSRFGIQKYEIYKYGRKFKKAKHANWWKFYNQLKVWGKKYDVKMTLNAHDVGIVKKPRIPPVFSKNDKVRVIIKAPGWIKGQMIGVAKNRCISINNCSAKINDKIDVKVVEDKNELYLGEII